MKRGTAAKVILGKDTLMDVPAGIVHGTDVILGGKAGLLNDFGGLVLSNNLMLGKKVSRGTITTVTVRGQSPLVLPDAIAGSLQAVKAFGGTEQNGTPTPDTPVDIVSNNGVLRARRPSGLPWGYTLLDYIRSTGTQYIDTGIIAKSSIKAEFMVDRPTPPANGAPTWQPLSSKSDSTNGQFAIFESTNSVGQKYIALTYGKTTSSTVVTASWVSSAFNQSKFVLDGGVLNVDNNSHVITSSQAGETFDNGNTLRLFMREGTSSSASCTIYYMKLWDGNTLVRNLVPCKNASNIVGMYDLVSEQFFTNAGTGDFVAGNVINDVEVYADGTQETIGIKGFGNGYIELEYAQSNGTQGLYIPHYRTEGHTYKLVIDVEALAYNGRGAASLGADYLGYQISPFSPNKWGLNSKNSFVASDRVLLTANCSSDGKTTSLTDGTNTVTNTRTSPNFSYGPSLFFDGYSANGASIKLYSAKFYEDGTLLFDLIPVKYNGTVGLYNKVDNSFLTPYAGTLAAGPEVYYSTAVAEMLLSVGNYTDEQEVISGGVTRKVGISVLDGTENWTKTTSSSSWMFYIDNSGQSIINSLCVCNVATGGTNSWTTLPDMVVVRSNRNFGFMNMSCTTINSTVDDWKQWLADQYNAGTPVIIVYPLATPTTESVTGQTLQVTGGDNILEITQASLDNLELEATYQSLVQLTIQEVEDANLNNNVEVTIS